VKKKPLCIYNNLVEEMKFKKGRKKESYCHLELRAIMVPTSSTFGYPRISLEVCKLKILST
jgi:hypothetical protein